VPTTAFGPQPTAQSSLDFNYYAVQLLPGSSNVYYVTNTAYNALFAVTSFGVVLIDAPGAFVLSAIRDVTQLPLTHLIYSHAHVDHIGAAGAVIAAAGGSITIVIFSCI
jgi:glyoxylase-like metal-dependent hydrolase (beta-lactamase superfamily II)